MQKNNLYHVLLLTWFCPFPLCRRWLPGLTGGDSNFPLDCLNWDFNEDGGHDLQLQTLQCNATFLLILTIPPRSYIGRMTLGFKPINQWYKL